MVEFRDGVVPVTLQVQMILQPTDKLHGPLTEALGNVLRDCRAVTVCDRECDIYDFFKCSYELDAPVLVRATSDRTINRASRYAEKDVIKLWDYMMSCPTAGSYEIDIPHKPKKMS